MTPARKGIVAVTGGNGHLGYNLVKVLAGRGYSVRATVRSEASASPLRALAGVEVVFADILDVSSLRRAFDGADGVFHSAAPNIPWSATPEETVEKPIIVAHATF